MTSGQADLQATQSPPPLRAADRWAAFVYRWRIHFFILLAIAYLVSFNGQWRIEPDSALYLSLGRNLAEGKGYTYLGAPHHLAYPGLPGVFAVLMKIFGSRVIWPEDVVMLLFAAAALVLTFKLIETHADRATAVVVTLGLGMCRTFYEHAFLLLTDMPFLVGVLAFLLGYERLLKDKATWRDWMLLIAGLAFLVVMRPTMWAFLPVAAIAVGWSMVAGKIRRGRYIALALVLAAGVIFVLADPRHSDKNKTHGVQLGDYEDVVVQLFRDPNRLREHTHEIWSKNIPELIHITPIAAFGVEMWPTRLGNIVVTIVLITATILLFRERALWSMWMAALVAMMILVLAVKRYYLPVLPLMVYAWWLSAKWVNRKIPGILGNLVFSFMLLLGTVPNCLKIGQMMIEQHRRPFLETYREGKFAYVHAMAREITSHVDEKSWVIAELKTGRVLSFLSQRNVIEAPDFKDNSPRALQRRKLYMITPPDETVRRWAQEKHVEPGEAVTTVERGALAPWKLQTAYVHQENP